MLSRGELGFDDPCRRRARAVRRAGAPSTTQAGIGAVELAVNRWRLLASAQTNVHLSTTFDLFGSLIDMRRMVIAVIPVLALLLTPGAASAARARHALPPKCAPSSHTVLADAQARVYATREGSLEYLSIRGCAYGQRRSFFISACNRHESATVCADTSHVALTGVMVASENAFVVEGRGEEKGIDEWHVEVRNLRTGRVLHEVPTGAPLKPESRYVGIGPIVGLVLKSDGSVAWIAEDYERSSVLGRKPFTIPYYDLYAVDKSGTRLLASGTDVDPTSLSLSVGSFSVNGYSRIVVGSTLYWTQGGKPFSATLN
jgi:hypothetical protein